MEGRKNLPRRFTALGISLEISARTVIRLDGEAVILGSGGIEEFDKLHDRKHDDDAVLIAFDLYSFAKLFAAYRFESARQCLQSCLPNPATGFSSASTWKKPATG